MVKYQDWGRYPRGGQANSWRASTERYRKASKQAAGDRQDKAEQGKRRQAQTNQSVPLCGKTMKKCPFFCQVIFLLFLNK